MFDAFPGQLGSPIKKKARKTIVKPFKCSSVCGKLGCTKAYAGEKALTAHQQGAFVCKKPGCGKSYATKATLKEHVEWHERPNGFECEELGCDKTFETKAALQLHLEWHRLGHRLGSFTCKEPNCGKSFEAKSTLQKHLEWHRLGGFTCKEPNCGKSFETKGTLQEHLEWHRLDGFTCKEPNCGNSYATARALKEHVELHEQPGALFICCEEGCTLGFSTRRGLRDHEERCGEGGYPCQWANCPTTFIRATNGNPSLSTPRRLLCALHSRLEYTHANTLWPGNSSIDYCTECTAKEGQSICAGFDGPPDANGIALKHQLCSAHAREAGTKSSFTAGASHVACEAYHVLADRLKLSCFKELNLDAGDHFHYSPGEDPTGRELKPFANQSIGVDGTFRDMQGRIIGFYQFHGNYFHGYPPGHPRHLTFGSGHRWGPSLYNNTMNRDFQYMTEPMWDVKTGGAVEAPLFEVWEHDFKAYKKALKIDVNATLKYNRYERIANTVPADVKRAMRDAMHVSEEGEPAGEHIQGGGCELCRAARSRVRGQV